jgi:CTP synthase
VVYVHVTLVPYLSFAGEMKTKPSQHSVKELLSLGIQPDVIVCRTERPMSEEMREKLSLFCNVDKKCVIQNTDAESIYEVPLLLEDEHFAEIVCERLKLAPQEPDLTDWRALVEKRRHITRSVTVGLVGKYVELHDAYLSVVEALNHAGIAQGTDVNIKWINAESLDNGDTSALDGLHGILVPGGFGDRGVAGMINAVHYARTRNIPLFGICLGLCCVVIEFARNILNWKNADSVEFRSTDTPVIDLMPEQYDIAAKGGTMRLGAHPVKLAKDTLAYAAYGQDLIYERHRHRYGVNNQYRNDMAAQGLVISGCSPDERRVEIVELPQDIHPWFVAAQFHPEFKSRITRPSPLFTSFIGACLEI